MADTAGGWGLSAGLWEKPGSMPKNGKKDGGIVGFSLEHIVKNTYIPRGAECALVFWLFPFWREDWERKSGMVDQLDFTAAAALPALANATAMMNASSLGIHHK